MGKRRKHKKRKGKGTEKRRIAAETDSLLGSLDLSGKKLVALQTFWESLGRFDRAYTKLNEARGRLRLVGPQGSLSLSDWQHDLVDCLTNFFNRTYETLGNLALLINHMSPGLLTKEKAWNEVGAFLNFLLREEFNAQSEVKLLQEAHVFRAFVAHPQQHRAHDWLTCAWPVPSGRDAMVVWFTPTGDFVYALFNADPYDPQWVPSVDHDSFKVPPRPVKVYRAVFRTAIKAVSLVEGLPANLPDEEFPLTKSDHETQSHVYGLIGARLGDRAHEAPSTERSLLYAKAEEKFRLALEVWDQNYRVLNNWGWMLFEQSRRMEFSEDKFKQLNAAIEKLQAAVGVKTDYLHGLTNLGEALLELTRYLKEPTPILDQAETVYARLAECCPESPCTDAECGLAIISSERSTLAAGIEADRLFSASQQRFSDVDSKDPDNPMVIGDWAITLARRGEAIEGPEGGDSLLDACEKFERAANLDPDDPGVLRNWATALESLAERSPDEEAEALRRLAKGKRALADSRFPSLSDSRG